MNKLIPIICALLISGCLQPEKSVAPTASLSNATPVKSFAPHAGPLGAVNKNFHQDYDKLVESTIAEIKQGNSPTIIVLGDAFILYSRRSRSQLQAIPPRFHELKAVGHVALGVFVALSHYAADGLNADELAMVQQDRDLIQQAHDALAASNDTAVQRKILQMTLAYLDKVLSEKQVQSKELQNYTREISPFLLQGAALAAKSQLDLVHDNVNAWRAKLTEDEWSKLEVVICASHQPRTDELVSQYFRRLLNEKPTPGAAGEDKIIYAEAVFTEDKAINVLARHIIDQKVGAAFFNDRFRLQEDLLSDATSEYLKGLLPK